MSDYMTELFARTGPPVTYPELLDFLQSLVDEEVSVTFGGFHDGQATFVAGMPGRLLAAEPSFDPVGFEGLHAPHGAAPPVFYVHGGQEAGYYPSLVFSEPLFEAAVWITEGDAVAVRVGGIVVTIARGVAP